MSKIYTPGSASNGVYSRFAWSKDWRGSVPWSLSGVPVPYVGISYSNSRRVRVIAFGPLALISVKIGADF